MKKITSKLFDIIFYSVCIGLITSTLLGWIRIDYVQGSSMEPTYKEGDVLLGTNIGLDKLEYGDVVVAKPSDKLVIKRLIGKPGDTIEFIDGQLYRNGEIVIEDYVVNKSNKDNMLVVLGESEYFICGDNRPVSYDSRIYGPVDKILQHIIIGER